MRTLALAIATLPHLCLGQGSLVPNGSFEQIVQCPTSTAQLHHTAHWMNPNAASPDLFHSCNPPIFVPPDTYYPHVGVPANAFGLQQAYSGDAFVGMYCFSEIEEDLREYVQVELTEPLLADVPYRVSFYTSVADLSYYAISSMGAHLSVEPVTRGDASRLDAVPQILHSPGFPLMDTSAWVLITDTFISSEGGERYLTIGNFNTDATSDTVLFNANLSAGFGYSYYYVDDVSVVMVDTPVGVKESGVLSFDVWPNPATEAVHVHGNGLARVRLLDLSGREILTERIASDMHTLHLQGIPPGLYLLEVTDVGGRRAVRRVVTFTE